MSIRNFKEQARRIQEAPGFIPYQPAKKGNLFSRAVDKLIATQAGTYNAVVHGKREGATLRFKEFMYSPTGFSPITQLWVARMPILEPVKLAMNVLSLGGVSRTQDRLNYDEIYHSFIVVFTADGKISRIERNHVVEAFDVSPNDDGWRKESFPIPLEGRVLTINGLILTASEGDPSFWQYNPSRENCQAMVYLILYRNGLLANVSDPATLEAIIPQDARAIVNSLGPLSGVPLGVTNLAGRLDRIRYGDGVMGKVRSGVNGRLTLQQMLSSLNPASG